MGGCSPPPNQKKRWERGERRRERKKKEKRGINTKRMLIQSFQEHVFPPPLSQNPAYAPVAGSFTWFACGMTNKNLCISVHMQSMKWIFSKSLPTCSLHVRQTFYTSGVTEAENYRIATTSRLCFNFCMAVAPIFFNMFLPQNKFIFTHSQKSPNE